MPVEVIDESAAPDPEVPPAGGAPEEGPGAREGIDERTDLPVQSALAVSAESIATAILECLGRASAELSVVLVGDDRMRELNRDWRGKDSTTDVLSFSQLEGEPPGGLSATPGEESPGGLSAMRRDQPLQDLGEVVIGRIFDETPHHWVIRPERRETARA